MKKNYAFNNANGSYDSKGSYKKIAESQALKNRYMPVEHACSAYSLHQIFRAPKNSTDRLSTIFVQISPANHDQRLPLIQGINSNLSFDVSLSVKNPKKEKLKNFLNTLNKFFSLNKEVFTNGKRVCNEEFNFYRFNKL